MHLDENSLIIQISCRSRFLDAVSTSSDLRGAVIRIPAGSSARLETAVHPDGLCCPWQILSDAVSTRRSDRVARGRRVPGPIDGVVSSPVAKVLLALGAGACAASTASGSCARKRTICFC